MWRRAEAEPIGPPVHLRLVRAGPTRSVALRVVRCTIVTNSPVAVWPFIIGRGLVVDIAIGADRASVRVDVTFVGKIIPHGVVWTASIVRLHISSVASRVTVDILI